MDNDTLHTIVISANTRNFWIKPVGIPGEEPDLHAMYTQLTIPINFSKRPDTIEIGDILIVYRIMVSKVMFIGEWQSPEREVTDTELHQHPWKERWPWVADLQNLSPIYGGKWSRFNIKPFSIIKEYNKIYPGDRQNLGSIQFGSDKLRVSSKFGTFIIRRITDIT